MRLPSMRSLRPRSPHITGNPASLLHGRLSLSLRRAYKSDSEAVGKISGTGMVLVFGEHRLDIARRELRRGTELVPLEPKAFDLLVFLVRNRDRVVSKNDLLAALWDGRIMSDSAITTRINV